MKKSSVQVRKPGRCADGKTAAVTLRCAGSPTCPLASPVPRKLDRSKRCGHVLSMRFKGSLPYAATLCTALAALVDLSTASFLVDGTVHVPEPYKASDAQVHPTPTARSRRCAESSGLQACPLRHALHHLTQVVVTLDGGGQRIGFPRRDGSFVVNDVPPGSHALDVVLVACCVFYQVSLAPKCTQPAQCMLSCPWSIPAQASTSGIANT